MQTIDFVLYLPHRERPKTPRTVGIVNDILFTKPRYRYVYVQIYHQRYNWLLDIFSDICNIILTFVINEIIADSAKE